MMSHKKETDYVPVCLNCENASILKGESNVLCKYRGVVSEDYKCRKHTYDPLKRIPAPSLNTDILSKEDLF